MKNPIKIQGTVFEVIM